jgi:SAM-dependent methyltransferase
VNPFDSCSEQYSQFRPDYPNELLGFICGLCHGLLVDVGAGTGKASAPLLQRGIPLVAVEPSLPMVRQGLKAHSQLRYICSKAEDLPIASASASVVTCAQAFHWLDSGRALREFARVLQPGGHICLFWNTRDASYPAAAMFENLIDKWNPDHVIGYRRKDWGERIAETELYDHVEYHRYQQTVPMTMDDWIGLSRSISYVQSVGPEKVLRFEKDLTQSLGTLSNLDCVYQTQLWCGMCPKS